MLTLLVVSDEGLGDGLADGIHLSNVTTTLDLDPDVNTSEPVLQDRSEH